MRHWLTPYPPTECFLLCSELSPANPGRDAEEMQLQEMYRDNLNSGKIDICDTTLERMQQMLQTFQSRLGGISDDIKHLQDDSLSPALSQRRGGERRKLQARHT